MRRGLLAAGVALLVVTGVMPATVASARAAPPVRSYEGTTSEGGRLSMSVVVKDGVPYLRTMLIDGPYRCEDGTGGDIALDGFGWWPSDLAGPVPTNVPLDLSENAGSFAYMMTGHLGPLRGSGTLTVLMPALTADARAAQVCTFGGTWSVERTDSSFSLKLTETVEGRGEGRVSLGLGMAGSLDSTELRTRPVRHYQGGTTQDTAMEVRTSRTDTGIALLYMTVGSPLPCEDGTEIGGTIYAHNYFDSTQVMPPGQLDLDIEPDAVPSGIALHVHGELDAHLGVGDLVDDLAVADRGPQGATLSDRRPDVGALANRRGVLSFGQTTNGGRAGPWWPDG